MQVSVQSPAYQISLIGKLTERRRSNGGIGKWIILRRGLGHAEIHFRSLCGSKVPVRAGILHLIEGFPEHSIVGLLTIEEKIDGLLYFFIIDLTIQVFVDDLGPLFRRNI